MTDTEPLTIDDLFNVVPIPSGADYPMGHRVLVCECRVCVEWRRVALETKRNRQCTEAKP